MRVGQDTVYIYCILYIQYIQYISDDHRFLIRWNESHAITRIINLLYTDSMVIIVTRRAECLRFILSRNSNRHKKDFNANSHLHPTSSGVDPADDNKRELIFHLNCTHLWNNSSTMFASHRDSSRRIRKDTRQNCTNQIRKES